MRKLNLDVSMMLTKGKCVTVTQDAPAKAKSTPTPSTISSLGVDIPVSILASTAPSSGSKASTQSHVLILEPPAATCMASDPLVMVPQVPVLSTPTSMASGPSSLTQVSPVKTVEVMGCCSSGCSTSSRRAELLGAPVKHLSTIEKAIKEFKASDALNTFVLEFDTLEDFHHDLATPTFWKGTHVVLDYVRKVVRDFDLSRFGYNIDAPSDSEGEEGSPLKQLKGSSDHQVVVTDQQVEEAFEKLEKETVAGKAADVAIVEKMVALGGVEQWTNFP
ncbi:hypothetical protein NE237_007802 [Protea cynaroides]|uniref:Uncharacterized protein n=1 Tax=Protea cynaroides TaxID=273540 RepID=A0A9Q0KPT4_9MAGN|nr:hypothetical protein NE237_007802 [Protea cynaroides]